MPKAIFVAKTHQQAWYWANQWGYYPNEWKFLPMRDGELDLHGYYRPECPVFVVGQDRFFYWYQMNDEFLTRGFTVYDGQDLR